MEEALDTNDDNDEDVHEDDEDMREDVSGTYRLKFGTDPPEDYEVTDNGDGTVSITQEDTIGPTRIITIKELHQAQAQGVRADEAAEAAEAAAAEYKYEEESEHLYLDFGSREGRQLYEVRPIGFQPPGHMYSATWNTLGYEKTRNEGRYIRKAGTDDYYHYVSDEEFERAEVRAIRDPKAQKRAIKALRAANPEDDEPDTDDVSTDDESTDDEAVLPHKQYLRSGRTATAVFDRYMPSTLTHGEVVKNKDGKALGSFVDPDKYNLDDLGKMMKNMIENTDTDDNKKVFNALWNIAFVLLNSKAAVEMEIFDSEEKRDQWFDKQQRRIGFTGGSDSEEDDEDDDEEDDEDEDSEGASDSGNSDEAAIQRLTQYRNWLVKKLGKWLTRANFVIVKVSNVKYTLVSKDDISAHLTFEDDDTEDDASDTEGGTGSNHGDEKETARSLARMRPAPKARRWRKKKAKRARQAAKRADGEARRGEEEEAMAEAAAKKRSAFKKRSRDTAYHWIEAAALHRRQATKRARDANAMGTTIARPIIDVPY